VWRIHETAEQFVAWIAFEMKIGDIRQVSQVLLLTCGDNGSGVHTKAVIEELLAVEAAPIWFSLLVSSLED
jgi:hypothetical protein